MLLLASTIVGLIALAVCVVTTALYIRCVRSLAPAYRALLLAEGDDIVAARDKYWALDRRQIRLGLTCAGGYAVGLLSIIPFGHAQSVLQWVTIGGVTLSFIVLSWFATFRKGMWEIQMEVEEEKHRKRMEELRSGKHNTSDFGA